MPENTRRVRSLLLRGRARPRQGAIDRDDFLHWRLEIPEPYPHVVHFGIVPRRGRRPAPFLHEVEQADEVLIEFDLTSRPETYDGVLPALETSLDRIGITTPGQGDDED